MSHHYPRTRVSNPYPAFREDVESDPDSKPKRLIHLSEPRQSRLHILDAIHHDLPRLGYPMRYRNSGGGGDLHMFERHELMDPRLYREAVADWFRHQDQRGWAIC